MTTLKEISELKNEIIKLTSSLKSLKSSPCQDKQAKIRIEESEGDSSAFIEESLERHWWKTHKESSRENSMKKRNTSKDSFKRDDTKGRTSLLISSRVEDL